jgi:HlyD family secretion protein
MEPTDQSHLKKTDQRGHQGPVIEFLPDADAIERDPMPAYIRSTLWVMAGALVCFLAWASFSEVETVVVAQGRLVNPMPNIVVQPLETSIIQKIEVRVGQVVRKGEVLATFDPTFAQADEAQLRARLQSLETQSKGLAGELSGKAHVMTSGVTSGMTSKSTSGGQDSKLQAQLASERQANFEAQVARLDQNLARVTAALETNRRDQDVLGQRMKSLLEMESMQESLMAQQFGARLQLLEARERRLTGQRELDLAQSKEHELSREKSALQAEKMAFIKGWRQKAMEDLLSTTRERDGIQEQLQKADKRKQLVALVSPVDAVVLDMAKLSQGSVIQAAEQMFTLVPLGSELEAEVKIDALDIGYIKLNDATHLKLDAFPFQKHGGLRGKVRTLSEDAFKRDGGAMGQGLDAYYLSRISLGSEALRNMSDKMRLLPGMTLSAEIVVGKRTVMSYLLWPLTKAMNESLREP